VAKESMWSEASHIKYGRRSRMSYWKRLMFKKFESKKIKKITKKGIEIKKKEKKKKKKKNQRKKRCV